MAPTPTPRPEPVPHPKNAPTLIDLARSSGIISPEQAQQLADLLRQQPGFQDAPTRAERIVLSGAPPASLEMLQGAETLDEAVRTRRQSDVIRLTTLLGSRELSTDAAAPALALALADAPEEARVAWSLPPNRFGKYVLITRLGSGAMGDVWRAWQIDLGRWVALKFLKGDNPDEIARFVQEARTAARLSHPNIVTTYEAGEIDGRRYIGMECLEGQDLSRITLDVRHAVEIMRDAARAVHYAHDQGVIHRDIKPSNLLLTRKQRLVVTDFGLAKMVQSASDVSQSGALVGTPQYMSPEQAGGRTQLDGRADVFALGATLYYLVTGRPPFTGDTWVEILRGVLQADPIPPRTLNSHVTREVQTIIAKAMEKDPARRYASAEDLARDLDRYLKGEAIHARPAGILYRTWLRARRNRVATFAMSLLVAVLSSLGTLWYITPGVLNLNIDPPGAAVRVAQEDVVVGERPLAVELPAGAYEVTVTLADHESEVREVIVERGKSKDLTLRLQHLQGRLAAESQPLGSEIEVDGVAYGSRINNLELDTGRHTLRAWSAGYFERTMEVDIGRGETARAFLWLEPGVAWVHLSPSIPAGGGSWTTDLDLDGDGVPELLHEEGPMLVFLRPQDGRELRRIPAARSFTFSRRLTNLGFGPVLLVAAEETDGLVLTCWDPRREGLSAKLWEWTGPACAYAQAQTGNLRVVTDLDGDGVRDLVLASRENRLFPVSGTNGAGLPPMPLTFAPEWLDPLDDRDPGRMIVLGAEPRPEGSPTMRGRKRTAAQVRLSNGAVEWSADLGVVLGSGLLDLDGDGVREVVWRTESELGVIEGATGKERLRAVLPTDLAVTGELGWSDLDADGVRDLLLVGREGGVLAVSGGSGKELWRQELNVVAAPSGPEGPTRLSDGSLLLLCQGFLKAVDPRSGAVRWRVAGDMHGAARLDWDGDGAPELLVGLRGNGLLCLDELGRQEWALPLGQDLTPIGLVNDCDGDGLSEILIHSPAAMIGVIRGPRKLWARKAGGPLQAAPVLFDAEGDGRLEVAQLGPWGQDRHLLCLDGRTGLVRWARTEFSAPNRGPGVGDVNGDGKPDLVMCGHRAREGQPRVFAFRGVDGQPVAEHPWDALDVYSAPAVVDLTGDGAADPVFQRWGNQDLAAVDGKTGALLWRAGADAPGMGAVAAADLDGDGKPELIAPFLNGRVLAVRGADASVYWLGAIDSDGTRAPAALEDVNGDGVPDVVIVSFRGVLWALDGRSGKTLWRAPGGSEGLGRPVVVRPDGECWVLAPLGGAGAGVYDARRQEWRWRGPAGKRVVAGPQAADLDGDGLLEAVIATWDGELIVADLASGRRLWSMKLSEGEIEADPAVADLDGDGVLEIVVADHAGLVQAISGRGTIATRRRR